MRKCDTAVVMAEFAAFVRLPLRDLEDSRRDQRGFAGRVLIKCAPISAPVGKRPSCRALGASQKSDRFSRESPACLRPQRHADGSRTSASYHRLRHEVSHLVILSAPFFNLFAGVVWVQEPVAAAMPNGSRTVAKGWRTIGGQSGLVATSPWPMLPELIEGKTDIDRSRW